MSISSAELHIWRPRVVREPGFSCPRLIDFTWRCGRAWGVQPQFGYCDQARSSNSAMQLDLVAFRIVQNQSLQVAVIGLEGLHVSTCRLQALQRFFNHWSLEYHVEP